MTELSFKASDYVLLAARMRVEARYSGPCARSDGAAEDARRLPARLTIHRCHGTRLRFFVCSAMQNVVLWLGTEIWAFIGA